MNSEKLPFDLQPQLESELIWLQPLQPEDFEALYTVASDPLIWEQHPNRDRYKKEVFEIFFKGAIESKGAFLICKAATGEIIGSTRYYDADTEKSSVAIGYTFIARSCWGGTYNPAVKAMMLGHAFRFVDHVLFHVGAVNIRSQKAIEKLGAVKLREEEMAYYGEPVKLNFIYRLSKGDWRG
ncbi:MAG: GNAT family N-acetyltransferase [Bacteroidia bacterium]